MTIKLPATLDKKVRAAARRRGERISVLARRALEREIASGGPDFAKLAESSQGIIQGPKDLSTRDFASLEAAARKAPVKITRRGKAIGVFSTQGGEKWQPPDFAARAKRDFGTRFSSVAFVDKLAAEGGR